jgi:hypothetical protein
MDMREEDTPAAYPYNTVDGATVESFILGWQIQEAMDFCTGRQEVFGKHYNYVLQEDTEQFFGGLVKNVGDDTRRIHALTTQLTGKRIADDDVTTESFLHYQLPGKCYNRVISNDFDKTQREI